MHQTPGPGTMSLGHTAPVGFLEGWGGQAKRAEQGVGETARASQPEADHAPKGTTGRERAGERRWELAAPGRSSEAGCRRWAQR